MTTLIDRVVGVAGVCSYTCKLGTFFVMPLTLPIPIFEKISLRGALEKSVKLWVLHKNYFLCNTRFLSPSVYCINRYLRQKLIFRNIICFRYYSVDFKTSNLFATIRYVTSHLSHKLMD